jgi:hypothetical protein
MRRINLTHVREYDDGKAGPESFTTGSAELSQESCRIVGDLALLTRPFADKDAVINFDEAERLAEEAIQLVIKRLDWMGGELGIAESPSGQLEWFPWFKGNDGLLRRPTRNELLNFEGESRLLWDALMWTNVSAEKSIRLLAAFGLFCCERARDAETRKHIGTIIEMYAAAGVLLGHANYLLGCMTEKGLGDSRYKQPMREGARRRWDSHPTQKAKAEIHEKWKLWQGDRSKYRYPRDFRRAMLLEFPETVDGTLKNWMGEWGKNHGG